MQDVYSCNNMEVITQGISLQEYFLGLPLEFDSCSQDNLGMQ